jgi:drug/metabolite transporter (DMT)-like permease
MENPKVPYPFSMSPAGMPPNLRAIPLIVLGVLLNAGAQIFLKKGLQAAGGLQLSPGPLLSLFLQPGILGGLACYAVSVVVWLGALSMVEVNYAYPFLALGFLANALMAQWFLGETIPGARWVALGIIILGVALQAWSGRGA